MIEDKIEAEDVLELILDKIEYKWKTVKEIQNNVETMLDYFKTEKFDRLQNKFGL